MASNPFSLPASWRLDLPTLTRLTETDIFAENELKQDIPSGLREENLAHIEITGLQDAGLHRCKYQSSPSRALITHHTCYYSYRED